MALEFLQAAEGYKLDGTPETRYDLARSKWNSRLGSARVQARNWRYGFFGLLVLSILLSAATIYQVTKYTVVPVIIEVSNDTGEPRIIGRVGQIDYVPQFAQIQFFLSHFVRDVREVIMDPVVMKTRWNTAYFYLRPRAANLLNAEANGDTSALNRMGKVLVAVEPITVVRVGEGDTYQIRWRESIFDQLGHKQESYTMTGVFSLEFETPTTEEAIAKNPLGIFISTFNWAKELNAK